MSDQFQKIYIRFQNIQSTMIHPVKEEPDLENESIANRSYIHLLTYFIYLLTYYIHLLTIHLLHTYIKDQMRSLTNIIQHVMKQHAQ